MPGAVVSDAISPGADGFVWTVSARALMRHVPILESFPQEAPLATNGAQQCCGSRPHRA